MKKGKSGGERSRYFSLTTYATEKQIKKVFKVHLSSLRAFCYIHHDQDEAEPHFHILIRTHSAWTCRQICNWFADLKDENKQKVNTFCEVASDMMALQRYILHDTDEAREEGKHQYAAADIKSYEFHELVEKKNAYDSSYEILEKVLLGVHPRELCRYYGRDYLYHFSQYHEMAQMIEETDARIYHTIRTARRMKPALEPITDDGLMEELEKYEQKRI